MKELDVNDLWDDSTNGTVPEQLQITFFSGLGVIVILLLVTVALLITVCCLACKIRALNRRWKENFSSPTASVTTSQANVDGNIAGDREGGEQPQLEGVKVNIAEVPPQAPAPDLPREKAGGNTSVDKVEDMYDSIEDLRMVSLNASVQQPQKGNAIPLQQYDTVTFKKDHPTQNTATASTSEAPPTEPIDGQAEYSVVMKKPPQNKTKPADEEIGDYNVLVHSGSTSTTSKPRQALVTYSALNTSFKKETADESGLGEEVPPPPVPPPISESNLLALGGLGDSNSTTVPTNELQQHSFHEASTRISPIPEETKKSIDNTGQEEGESLYMNV